MVKLVPFWSIAISADTVKLFCLFNAIVCAVYCSLHVEVMLFIAKAHHLKDMFEVPLIPLMYKNRTKMVLFGFYGQNERADQSAVFII